MSAFHENLKQIASRQGLDFLDSVDLNVEDEYLRFDQWISDGKHAEMHYLEKNKSIRKDPTKLLESAKSALVFAFNYKDGDRWQSIKKRNFPVIAQYARFPDYHRFLKKKTVAVMDELTKSSGESLEYLVCIDSKPLLERAIAHKTNSGFIGKNTCFIHKEKGSFLLLSIVLVNRETGRLQSPTSLSKEPCGTCKRCQTHCPTGALNKDYSIDSRKCLSYWTIEHRGVVPVEFWPHFKYFWFGCDICQLVCPFNRGVELATNEKKVIVDQLDLLDIALMDQAYFERVFGGTSLTRAKRSGLRRNALIAMYARGDMRFLEARDRLNSEQDPLVRQTFEMILTEL